MEIMQLIPVPLGLSFWDVYRDEKGISASPIYYLALVKDDSGATSVEGLELLDGSFVLTRNVSNTIGIFSEEELRAKYPDINFNRY